MKASNETRLRRIEADQGSRQARMFVIQGATPEERDRYIAGLIRSGQAKPTDIHLHGRRSGPQPHRSWPHPGTDGPHRGRREEHP
jgi:hypothetical protein